MILNEKKNLVEMSSPNQTTEFKIALNRKSFKALSGAYYSDKILAVVREISTNAYDAHLAVGKSQVPFEIHVPNQLEPYFEVKDFGTGLSEEEVTNLYTTYFASTKDNNPDAIGCWGLGSKSPFVYTKQFTVESRQNGIKKVYNVFENENGFPCVTKFGETTTTEPDGLTVNVPVQRTDAGNFADKITNLFRWWNTIPVIKGGKINIQTPKYSVLEKEYGILENNEGHVTVVMGGIPYIVNTDKININYRILRGHYGSGICNNLVIFANLGDVDITLGRENLSFEADGKTQKFLDNIFKKVEKEIEDKFKEEINKCNSLNEAKKFAKNYTHSFDTFEFKGKRYRTTENIQIIEKHFYDKKYILEKSIDNSTYKVKLKYISFFQDYPVYKLDHPRMASLRIKAYQNSLNLGNKYYLYTDDVFDEIFAEYGIPVLKVSSLPKVKGVGTGITKDKIVLKEFKPHVHQFRRSITPTTIDFKTTTGIFVPVNGSKFIVNGKEREFYFFNKLVSLLSKANKLPKKQVLYVIKDKNKNELIKYKWTSFDDYMNQLLTGISPSTDKSHLAEAKNNINDVWFQLAKYKNEISKSSKLYSYLEEVEELEKNYKDAIKDSLMFDIYYKFTGIERNNLTHDTKISQTDVYKEYDGLNNLIYCKTSSIVNFIKAIDFYRAAGNVY